MVALGIPVEPVVLHVLQGTIGRQGMLLTSTNYRYRHLIPPIVTVANKVWHWREFQPNAWGEFVPFDLLRKEIGCLSEK